MPHIIIRWKSSSGKRRSEIEKNLRKEGWGSSLTEEQIDKCDFIERKIKDSHGADKSFLRTTLIDSLRDKSDKK